MRKIFLIRHGDTSWSLSGKHTGSTDISLAERGIVQARHLAKRLEHIHFEKILTSPLKRAMETCEIAGFGPRAEIDDDLKEWDYGEYEGLTTEEIRKKDPHWNIFIRQPPKGESIQHISDRAERILKKASVSGNVLIFSSGHFLRVLACRWIQMPADQGKHFALYPASLSILGFERENPTIVTWNDISHLTSDASH